MWDTPEWVSATYTNQHDKLQSDERAQPRRERLPRRLTEQRSSCKACPVWCRTDESGERGRQIERFHVRSVQLVNTLETL